MNLTTLIAQARIKIGDNVANQQDYRCSDAQINFWIQEGNLQAFRRLRYKVDNSLTVPIVANTATYNLPSGVISLRRAKLASQDMPLYFTTYREMDANVSGWETHTGTPSHILLDLTPSKLTLYPKPDANDTLNLIAILEPATITAEAEIPNRFAYGIINWVAYRAFEFFQAEDLTIDTRFQGLSDKALAEFEVEFGKASSAFDEVFNARNMPFDNYDGFL